jgi:hypothetical protein
MTPQDIEVGDVVINWQGGWGKVEAITADGWFAVRDLCKNGGLDEWQGFQLRLRAKGGPQPKFFE